MGVFADYLSSGTATPEMAMYVSSLELVSRVSPAVAGRIVKELRDQRSHLKLIASENFFIKPTIGVNANFLLNPSFGESGKSELLDVDSADYTSVKTLVGFEATYSFWESFYVAGRMFYTHEFGDDSYDTTAMFINSGSTVSSFRVKGWEMDRDAGVFGIGVGYDITKALRVYVDYSAEVSNEVYHNLNAGIQFRF